MCIFGGKKGFLHKVELGLCIFEGKAGNLQNEGLAQREAEIVHF